MQNLLLIPLIAVAGIASLVATVSMSTSTVTQQITCDVLVAGGSTAGSVAAIAAAREGVSVCIAEETGIFGGQYTTQGLSAVDDDGIGIGFTTRYLGIYDELNQYVYKNYFGVNNTYGFGKSQRYNPGACWVGRLCFEPKIAYAFFKQELTSGKYPKLKTYPFYRPISVQKSGNRVTGVMFEHAQTGARLQASAKITIDGTELGDVIHLSGAEYRLGPDLASDTGEVLALRQNEIEKIESIQVTPPTPYKTTETRSGVRVQPMTFIFAMSKNLGGAGVSLPSDLQTLSSTELNDYLNFLNSTEGFDASEDLHKFDGASWNSAHEKSVHDYRRILALPSVNPEQDRHLSLINLHNDYPYAIATDYIGVKGVMQIPYDRRKQIFNEAKNWSHKYALFLHRLHPSWLLQLDTMPGTTDGFSAYPYIREGRRLLALQTIRADDIALWCRYQDINPVTHTVRFKTNILPCAYDFHKLDAYTSQTFGRVQKLTKEKSPTAWKDTIALGHYSIDIHSALPTKGRKEFNTWMQSLGYTAFDRALVEAPLAGTYFKIPYGATVPVNIDGLLASGKNIGTTHISNGGVRLHPPEAQIGESVGVAAAFAVKRNIQPRVIYKDKSVLNEYIAHLAQKGRTLNWFTDVAYDADPQKMMKYYEAIQYVGARAYLVGSYEGDTTTESIRPKFLPTSALTRGQTAIVLMRLMDWAPEYKSGAPHFDDVPVPTERDGLSTGQELYDAVETLYMKGISSGCGNRQFCTSRGITRAEIAVFLVRALGTKLVATSSTPSFNDVSDSHWAHSFIETMKSKGWMLNWVTGKEFKPDTVVTREEMAQILYNINLGTRAVNRGQFAQILVNHMGWSTKGFTATSTSHFSDIPKYNYASLVMYNALYLKEVETLYAKKITNGCATSRYCPTDSLTRGELSIFIARAYGLSEYKPSNPTYSDVPTTHKWYGYIERAVAEGWFEGLITGTMFNPSKAVTRQELAQILSRVDLVQAQ